MISKLLEKFNFIFFVWGFLFVLEIISYVFEIGKFRPIGTLFAFLAPHNANFDSPRIKSMSGIRLDTFTKVSWIILIILFLIISSYSLVVFFKFLYSFYKERF